MSEIGKLTGMVVGQYGEDIILTIVDEDGDAIDISSYTTSLQVTLRDPYTLNTKSYSASFNTTGTDGKIKFSPASGDIDRAGDWEGQVRLEKASTVAFTRVFKAVIDRRLSAA